MNKYKLSDLIWNCNFHIILVPKYRYKVFKREVKEAHRDELKKLCVWLQILIT